MPLAAIVGAARTVLKRTNRLTLMAIAALYREAQSSFVELARSLSEEQWEAPSPCTPGWAARDLLSHAAGVAIDIVEGNVEGAATPPWTAAQVQRWRDVAVDELIDRWNQALDQTAEAIEFIGEARPIVDCHTHEHDLRCAIGSSGNRDSELVDWIADRFVAIPAGRAIDLDFVGGVQRRVEGPGGAIGLSGVTAFELARSRLGRRSSDQVRAYAWSEPVPDEVLDGWFLFGPSEVPIIE